eukprot:7143990-Pyramimonas_sp.AAC.1
MEHMREGSAQCIVEESLCSIPDADLAVFGIICKDKSPLNKNRAKFKGTCQRGDGLTGTTWVHVENYLRAHRAPLVLIENVKQLMEVPSDGKLSDLQHIHSALRDLGHSVSHAVVEALDHGSLTKRER